MAPPVSGHSSRETSNEFVVIPPAVQVEIGSLHDEQEMDEPLDEPLDEAGSDEEVESLLQRRKESSELLEGEKETTRRSSKIISTVPLRTGEALNKSATKRMLRSILGEMSKAERKVFFREMLTQVGPFFLRAGSLLTSARSDAADTSPLAPRIAVDRESARCAAGQHSFKNTIRAR